MADDYDEAHRANEEMVAKARAEAVKAHVHGIMMALGSADMHEPGVFLQIVEQVMLKTQDLYAQLKAAGR